MPRVIATAGKGGTGKTTTAAAIIRALVEGGRRPVLAVDADANSNLSEALGIEVPATIGKSRELFLREQSSVPAGMTKEAYYEMHLSQAVAESDDIDMLVMGRPEGSGCYCYANNILRSYLDRLQENYPWIVVDNEAGLEHISRKTTRNPDVFLVVSDHQRRGLEAARRIKELIEELDVETHDVGLVINRVPAGGIDPAVERLATETGLEIWALLPDDPEVARFDIEHRSVFELPADNPFVAACRALSGKLHA